MTVCVLLPGESSPLVSLRRGVSFSIVLVGRHFARTSNSSASPKIQFLHKARVILLSLGPALGLSWPPGCGGTLQLGSK